MSAPRNTILGMLLARRSQRDNLKTLCGMIGLALALVLLFTALFFVLMQLEGRDHSLVSGFYWTTTVMTTLGFGDITFIGDVGRAFSIVVMITGMLFQSVILPFVFIHFLWTPWVESHRLARIPRQVGDEVSEQVLLTQGGAQVAVLLRRLAARGVAAWVLNPDDADTAVRHDRGEQVLAGQADDPAVWRAAGVERATLAVCNRSDAENALAVLTLREVAGAITVVATADDPAMADVLRRAGADLVVQPHALVGTAMALRARAGIRQGLLGTLGELSVATLSAAALRAHGQTLEQLDLPARHGIQVLAIWERGRSLPATNTHRLDQDDTLVIAGTASAIAALGEAQGDPGHVIVAGAGRVARAASLALRDRGAAVTVLAPLPPPWLDGIPCVTGLGTDAAALERAGLAQAAALLVTTHDDALNTVITLRARLLRTDLEIVARAEGEVNVSSLYRAGADLVISRPSLVANAIFNALRRGQVMLVAEGLFAVRVPVPAVLAGQRLRDTHLRQDTGLSVVALEPSALVIPEAVLAPGGHLILAGPEEAVDRWYARFQPQAEVPATGSTLHRILPFLRTRR
jgi:Trk K+ transport system NAD-binding subunit